MVKQQHAICRRKHLQNKQGDYSGGKKNGSGHMFRKSVHGFAECRSGDGIFTALN